jgi:hypothetical protein
VFAIRLGALRDRISALDMSCPMPVFDPYAHFRAQSTLDEWLALLATTVMKPLMDEADFQVLTHHVLEDDLKQSAAVAASLIYQLAMRNERVPRKPPPSH